MSGGKRTRQKRSPFILFPLFSIVQQFISLEKDFSACRSSGHKTKNILELTHFLIDKNKLRNTTGVIVFYYFFRCLLQKIFLFFYNFFLRSIPFKFAYYLKFDSYILGEEEGSWVEVEEELEPKGNKNKVIHQNYQQEEDQEEEGGVSNPQIEMLVSHNNDDDSECLDNYNLTKTLEKFNYNVAQYIYYNFNKERFTTESPPGENGRNEIHYEEKFNFIQRVSENEDGEVIEEEEVEEEESKSFFQRVILSNIFPGWKLDVKTHPDASLSIPELIRKNGYPVEIHDVITKDGYILSVVRIKHGKNENENFGENNKKKVVFLQHGLVGSAADWIMNYPEKALAYKMADENYDVWLGNVRGNFMSRRHTHLNPEEKEFWNFSMHEMGAFDIPAVIDFILNLTQQEKLTYIGHSMGTLMFWVLLSTYPEYNEKIEEMYALAPVTDVQNMTSPLRLLCPIIDKLEIAGNLLGIHEFLTRRPIKGIFAKLLPPGQGESLISNISFLICGYNEKQLNEEFLPLILANCPAGTSTKTLFHFGQMIKYKQFQQYDYGPKKNMEIYGIRYPPGYNLKNVKVPVYIYHAESDLLSVTKDVERLAEFLPNVKLVKKVEMMEFNHLDFIWGKDADTYVYNSIIESMKNQSKV